MTFSEENYLKAIYHLEKQFSKGVSTNALAEKMQTKASSATDMIKRLADKDLLIYRPYQGVRLTDSGRKHALKVIRKHRLWEYFLVEKLNFNWDEVHEVAEQLEHIKSEKLTDKLDEFLEFPKADPHGDLIPDKNGKFPVLKKILLSKCQQNDIGKFVGVRDSSKDFLQYLDKQKIALGTLIKIVEVEDFDQSILANINKKEIRMSHKIASNLFVKLE